MLSLSRDARRFLDNLDAKQYRQVMRRFLALTLEPFAADSQQIEGSSYQRADQGEYRIVYFLENDVVFIVMIGKRNDDEAYTRLKRK